jgi:hypothetical protein
MYNFQEDVGRGAALLDEKLGPDWIWRVNLDRLRLNDCLRCVLGQLGNFSDNCRTFGFADKEGKFLWTRIGEYGFGLREGVGDDDIDMLWDNLTNTWKLEILRRRADQSVLCAKKEETPVSVG